MNAPKYYPLRLKLSSALIRVGYHAKVYIPLSPFYLDILSKRDLYKTSNRGGDQPIEWETMIKVQKQVLRTGPSLSPRRPCPPQSEVGAGQKKARDIECWSVGEAGDE